MNRLLRANWQYALLADIAKGSFAIEPRIAIAHIERASEIMTRGHIPTADLPDIGEIQFTSYSDAGPMLLGNLDDAHPGSIVSINLSGTMLKYGTWCAYGTEEIAAAIEYAAGHDNVTAIVLDIDSGGGSVSAIAPLVHAIQYAQSKGKPVVASLDTCCSAAYYAASYCDSIIANNNISAIVGSIGVMCTFQDLRKYYEKEGIETHILVSNHSADKNKNFYDALDKKPEAFIKEELDPLALQFQEAVKANRAGKLLEDEKGVLTGGVFYADRALELGMIDKVGTSHTAIQEAARLALQQYTINSH